MFSRTADYSLRAVLALAQEPARNLTAVQIAKLAGIPVTYSPKVLRALARAGILRATRGLSGGFQLAQAPEQLTLLAVVRAATRVRRGSVVAWPAFDGDQCFLNQRIDVATQAFEDSLDAVTVHDVACLGGKRACKACGCCLRDTWLVSDRPTRSYAL